MFIIKEIISATEGRLRIGDPGQEVGGVGTDSRTIRPGEMFVALEGCRFDGHDFIEDALERGAVGILAKGGRPFPYSAERRRCCVVEVDDTLRAYGRLAQYHRLRFRIPVVAISGSVGKTTVKRMIVSTLSRRHGVCFSEKSHNNLVGLPQTLLKLGAKDEMLVVELGTDRPGEIAQLAALASPTIGVITHVSQAHLNRLESLSGVAAEKAALFESLAGDGGKAVLRQGVPFESSIRSRCAVPILTFGLGAEADARAENIRIDEQARPSFRMRIDNLDLDATLELRGPHQIWNALAASLVCHLLGCSGEEILGGLRSCRPGWNRSTVNQLQNGATLLADAYNANPASVRAALDTLMAIRGHNRYVILGDMNDLGSQSDRIHRHIGSEVGQRAIKALLVLGDHWEDYAQGAMDAGMDPHDIHPFNSHREIVEFISPRLCTGDVALVKGSRTTEMERVCEGLVDSSGLLELEAVTEDQEVEGR